MTITPQRRRSLETNIHKYYLMRIMVKRLVWPILTLFLLRNQLTAEQIGTIFAAGQIITLVLQVPTGIVADRIGRTQALFISFLGQALSMYLFAVGQHFGMFMLANAVYWAFGSLMSGTHEAMIYETLGELGRQNEIKAVTGKALFYSQVLTGLLFTGVPLLATYSLRLPFLLNVVVFLATAVLALTLTEPKRYVSISDRRRVVGPHGFRQFIGDYKFLIITAFFSTIGAINGILESFRQVYLDAIHLNLAFFGLVYLALRLAVGIAGISAERLQQKFGQRTLLASLPIITLVTYIGLFLFNSLYGLLFVVLDGFQDGLSRPIEQEYLNSSINHRSRATLISLYYLCEGVLEAGLIFLGGVVITTYGIHAGFLFAACLVLVFGLPLTVAVVRQGPPLKTVSA